MAGIYIHIPFCKQACFYCDFHFSTSMKKKSSMVNAICHEMYLRKTTIAEPVETIYFGGGTPSLLTSAELEQLFNCIDKSFQVKENAEITLEANPDDLTEEKLIQLSASKINRLSIGVQSFFQDDLVLMNRAHNSTEALNAIQLAKKYFDNISIDLIYGIPDMSLAQWKKNLAITLDLEIPHVSSYALTVEPNTALKSMIEKGKIKPVDEDKAKQHFDVLQETLTEAGFVNYEFSNFGKLGYFSKNNTAYWMGKPYLGIGPSAHSFDGEKRSWNVNNNTKYLKAIEQDELPFEEEKLSVTDRYNEYLLTRLRTMWGVSEEEILSNFGKKYLDYFIKESKVFFEDNLLEKVDKKITITLKGKFLSDGIAADLFYID